PQIATEDGGIIGKSGIIYDQNGGATGQTVVDTPSWTAQSYVVSGGMLSDIALAPPQYASSFETVVGGNLSGNSTSLPFLTWFEGVPLFGRGRGPKCQLGSNKQTLSGDVLQQYNSAKQALLTGGYITSAACTNFYNANNLSRFFTQLQMVKAVSNQVPYDGPQTTISMYDAGLWSQLDSSKVTFPDQWKRTPVCSNFGPNKGTVAEAQVHSPA